ncbi:unnamed protein product, partial [Amoebophrya sp. A120]
GTLLLDQSPPPRLAFAEQKAPRVPPWGACAALPRFAASCPVWRPKAAGISARISSADPARRRARYIGGRRRWAVAPPFRPRWIAFDARKFCAWFSSRFSSGSCPAPGSPGFPQPQRSARSCRTPKRCRLIAGLAPWLGYFGTGAQAGLCVLAKYAKGAAGGATTFAGARGRSPGPRVVFGPPAPRPRAARSGSPLLCRLRGQRRQTGWRGGRRPLEAPRRFVGWAPSKHAGPRAIGASSPPGGRRREGRGRLVSGLFPGWGALCR